MSMPRGSDIIPVTDLRQDAAAALKRVRATKQPLIITQRAQIPEEPGRPAEER
jgi:hypothetical protein